jgi:carbamoyltransferase
LFFAELIKGLQRARFDNLAAGLQLFTEEIVVRWINGNIKKYGSGAVLCSGGVFMNVKMNMLLSQMKQVTSINVFPSCGDETNIFGAAYEHFNQNVKKEVNLLDKFTLGTDIQINLDKITASYSNQIQIEKQNDVNAFIAEQLVKNKIIARCSGPMEFGARALGNRSILAAPQDPKMRNKLNKVIKEREGFRPFAPSVVLDQATKYFDIKEPIPFMNIVVKPKTKTIPSATHIDNSCRVQTVSKEENEKYYLLLNEVKKWTGSPILLNTSFNLKDQTITLSPEDAIKRFLKSKIDFLVINNYLIQKK